LDHAFGKLKNAISTDQMRQLNYKVDGEKLSPKDVAAEWVRDAFY
jgi:glycine betaine/choline ABC-type transport system substrate-binding protein